MRPVRLILLAMATALIAQGCASGRYNEIHPIWCGLGGAVATGLAVSLMDSDLESEDRNQAAAAGFGAGTLICAVKNSKAAEPAPRAVAPAPAPAPVDSDGDGVTDDRDACPGTPAGTPVDSRGCPLPKDGDKDGVKDDDDHCLDTPMGTEVNGMGCAKERNIKLEGVHFEFDSARLTAESMAILDRTARVMKENSDLNFTVGGHTDSMGSDTYNMTLSDRRAKAVRDYLISKGVDGSNLTAMGYGESRPVASNDTEAGRAENRRVELSPRM